MKKWSIALLGSCLAVFMFVSVAKAGMCDFHHWPQGPCNSGDDRIAAEKCDYHQWPNAKCKAAPVVTKLVLKGVYFDTGSSKIKPVSYGVLNGNIKTLKARKNRNKSIIITGYTDNVGKASYNEKLSKSRAESIMNYFASKGIKSGRMTALGMGEANPIATNTTAKGRALNRRIEVEFK